MTCGTTWPRALQIALLFVVSDRPGSSECALFRVQSFSRKGNFEENDVPPLKRFT